MSTKITNQQENPNPISLTSLPTQQNQQQMAVTFAPWLEKALENFNSLHSNEKLNELVNDTTSLQLTTTSHFPKPKNKPIIDEEYVRRKAELHKEDKLPVQPFRDKKDIERAKAYFHDIPSRYKGLNMRNYAMFVLALNTARRTGDITWLQVCDVLNENGEFKKHLILNEGKTNKRAVVFLHPHVKKALAEYLDYWVEAWGDYKMSDFLFTNYKTKEPLGTNAVWKIYNKMSKALKLDYNIGAHTPRKTFASQAAKNNPDDSATEIKTSKFLNHANVETTHSYMQAGQDEMDDYVLKNGL